jgi:hypothetical protein
MKHVMYGEKSLLMDDDSADALIEYAGVIAQTGSGDTVRLRAAGSDGNAVEVVFLLNASTGLIVESASAQMDAPTNDDAVAEIRRKIDLLRNPPSSVAEMLEDAPALVDFDDIR